MTKPSSNTETVYYLTDEQLAHKIADYVGILETIIGQQTVDLNEFDKASVQFRTYVLEQQYRRAEYDMMIEQTKEAYYRWLKSRAEYGN